MASRAKQVRAVARFLVMSTLSAGLCGQATGNAEQFYEAPDIERLATGGMREVLERHAVDLSTHRRFHDAAQSPTRRARLARFYQLWRDGLARIDFDALPRDQQVDYLLLVNRLKHQTRQLEIEQQRWQEVAELLPFAETIVGLQESRRRLEPVDARSVATELTRLAEEIDAFAERLREGMVEQADAQLPGSDQLPRPEKTVADRAARETRDLARTLSSWFTYYSGYDPTISWWVGQPSEKVGKALDDYATLLREKIVGVEQDDDDTILGEPIGREALLAELASELIPYTPEQLVAIAEREFAWCDAEMLRAARDLEFGDDWHAALEHVKSQHVEPGEQPALIRDLAWEAVAFLEQRELLTIPLLAKTSWRMEMMTPERQKYTPYFTGGEVIRVSFPTDAMSHADKLMSMRGNNRHFSRATVHHELIPGHHLQQFMNARHATHRRGFGTPFWGEGWALYWELRLWDLDFARSAEDRIGMLFWRRHRCARIIFSLSFHLGTMTPEQCIELLIERVGHERANATAEVRRSVQGGYGPLYQCAYMLGGLQFRALHQELVVDGSWSERDFHDAVLRQNSIPVELVRAALSDQPLSRDFRSSWKFCGEIEVR